MVGGLGDGGAGGVGRAAGRVEDWDGDGAGVVLDHLLIERIDFGRLRSSLAAEIPWPPCRDRQSSGRRGTLGAPSRANARSTPSAPPPRNPRRATRVNPAIPDQSPCEALRRLLH